MKTKTILNCLLLAVCFIFFTTAKAQVNEGDSLALVDLYNSTNGPKWVVKTNWLIKNPVSTWYGVKLTGDRVTYLRLVANSLTGSIPAAVGDLTAIEYLDLGTNHLSGAIPSFIGNLSNLTSLLLNSNELSDSIPSAIGNLQNLRSLLLSSNFLSGSIPDAIGKLKNLTGLYLGYNRLSGPIPSSIGNFTNLVFLQLYSNRLSGAIPPEIGNLVRLYIFEAQDNHLSGELPLTITNLKQLNYFNLAYNQLTQYKYIEYAGDNPIYIKGYLFNNHFTFDGLEFISKKFKQVRCDYQARIPIHRQGNTLSVSAGGKLQNNTYYWYKKNTKGYITIHGDSTFTPTEDGIYHAEVSNAVATNVYLRSDNINFTVAVDSGSNYLASRVSNGSIQQSLKVTPNPASNTINIQLNGTAVFTLYDNEGKLLLSKRITNNATINVSNYANGAYYLRNSNTGKVHKIIISH